MKFTTIVYKLFISTILIIPLKLRILFFKCLKFLKIPHHKFYKDFRYYGSLKIEVNKSSFKMEAYGGTIENEILWNGIHNSLEPETFWIFTYLIHNLRISSIIDVGANTGLYSLYSKTLNKDLKIIAFEPSKSTYVKLVKNVNDNFNDIKCEPIALSNLNGNLIFYDSIDENQTNASLSDKMLFSLPEMEDKMLTYNVDVMTLDRYVELNLIKQIDFIKVDIELHEPEFFDGAIKAITNFQPFLIFEVLTKEVALKLNVFFGKIDYELYDMIEFNGKFFLKKIEILEERPNGNWNYFGIPINKIEFFKNVII